MTANRFKSAPVVPLITSGWKFSICGLTVVVLLFALLFIGTVDIPASAVWRTLCGRATPEDSMVEAIVWAVRMPMALTALAAGASLAVAGLLLQTTFANPLAGPSIMGVSTGASFGVAVVMLGCGSLLGFGAGQYVGALVGALIGSAVVLGVLLIFSMFVRSNAMLLIFGILVGYLASSGISLLNFFSTQQGVHSYVIWGMGSFSGVTPVAMLWLLGLTVAGVAGAFLCVKPLNALLLGVRYAESMGISVRATRNRLLALSGILTAAVTAFCGPIAFLGLVMPHVARMIFRTSNHVVLLPATALVGAAGAMGCALVGVSCGGGGIIPVNAITPVISVPIIIYVIVKRKKP